MKKKKVGRPGRVHKESFLRYLLRCQSFAKAARRFGISRQRSQQLGIELGLELRISPKGIVRPKVKKGIPGPQQEAPQALQKAVQGDYEVGCDAGTIQDQTAGGETPILSQEQDKDDRQGSAVETEKLNEFGRTEEQEAERMRAEHLTDVIEVLFRGEDHNVMCDSIATFFRAMADEYSGSTSKEMMDVADSISNLIKYDQN